MLKNGIIWMLGLAIALASGLTAVGAVAKDKAPAMAVTMKPMNGFAAENLAVGLIKNFVAENLGQFPDRVTLSIVALAQKAFVAEPVTPGAVGVLALARGGNATRKLMENAALLSRRQPLVTGWMITDSGAHEDVPALLNHYDTLLRTSTSAAPVVIPVMARALSNDNFIAPFARLLANQPPWAIEFWAIVVGEPDSLRNATRLRERVYNPNESKTAYRDADLIRALIHDQQFDLAVSLYRLLSEQTKASNLVENGSFETEPKYPPLDWELFSTGEYGAVITEGKLELSAIRSSGGLFARQLIKLPARALTMKVNLEASISGDNEMFVALTCAQSINDPPQAIRIPLKSNIGKLQINNLQSGCSFYFLDIIGRASDNANGFDISITYIGLQEIESGSL